MKITGIQTPAIRAREMTLEELIDRYVPSLSEGAIVAISSKVVALCEGRAVKVGTADVQALARAEAEYYLSPDAHSLGYSLTVNRHILISKAGIDESNTGGNYVYWPQDPQASANFVRDFLTRKFGVQLGVILTDSRVTPMRRGVIGVGLAHSGFAALRSYVGTPDIFGQYDLKYTYASIIDGLAVAAVVEMGEGDQRTPIAVITDAGFVDFQERNPTEAELELLAMPLEDDIFGDMLAGIKWDKRPGKP
jgi:dihydrofolate synthase / folylpolyglutamate synthase